MAQIVRAGPVSIALRRYSLPATSFLQNPERDWRSLMDKQNMVRLQSTQHFSCGKRMTEKVSLSGITANRAQDVEPLPRRAPSCCHFHAEFMPHFNGFLSQCRCRRQPGPGPVTNNSPAATAGMPQAPIQLPNAPRSKTPKLCDEPRAASPGVFASLVRFQ